MVFYGLFAALLIFLSCVKLNLIVEEKKNVDIGIGIVIPFWLYKALLWIHELLWSLPYLCFYLDHDQSRRFGLVIAHFLNYYKFARYEKSWIFVGKCQFHFCLRKFKESCFYINLDKNISKFVKRSKLPVYHLLWIAIHQVINKLLLTTKFSNVVTWDLTHIR